MLHIAHFLYPFSRGWTFGLLLFFGFYKESCYEHSLACLFGGIYPAPLGFILRGVTAASLEGLC